MLLNVVMGAKRVKGILLDVDYVSKEGKSTIRLFLREEKGIKIYKDENFRPYFFKYKYADDDV